MECTRKMLCGNPVRDALRAIGRTASGTRPPVPSDFTAEQRYRMFRAVLREQVYPMRGAGLVGPWATEVETHTLHSWKLWGRRRFICRVRASGRRELALADYSAYDLSPLRGIVGGDGPLFCRLLSAQDAAEMELRMKGMESDLAVLARNLSRAHVHPGSTGSCRYRVELYERAFEVELHTGMGGWAWSLLK